MVRRLEKIEKELGYCQIKIEREQRLRFQLQFLSMHRRSLDEAMARMNEVHREAFKGDGLHAGNTLNGLGFTAVQNVTSVERTGLEVDRLREAFRVAGAFDSMREERVQLDREIEEVEARVASFATFRAKRVGLAKEREQTLRSIQMDPSSSILEMSERFEQTEKTWNTLTEDLMNLEEAIYHVNFALDYLRSARTFLLSARGQFSLDSWLRDGYLLDLFKHSEIGRAKEMIEGADRNLRSALRELIALDSVAIQPQDFENLLFPLLDALFDDLFISGRIAASLRCCESRIQRLERLFRELDALRERLMTLQNEEERQRVRLFNQIGSERRKLPAMSKS